MDEISDSEKKAIESGIADANDGKLNSHSEAKNIYGKWL
jgi:predicted transcriptional regulator